MKRIPRIVGLGLLALLVTTPLATVLAQDEESTVRWEPVTQVKAWQLLKGSGAELYQQLCSSCHGLDGTGSLAAAKALALPPPDLTRLREVGIPKEHWAYVLQSSCGEAHHQAPDGTATMPCWRRIFRHTVRSDMMPLVITTRLVDYVDSIQTVAAEKESPSPNAGG